MALQLELTAATSIPLEVEGVLPEVVRDRSLAEIERIDVYHGNEKRPLGDFFRVSGDPTDEVMYWQGNLAGVHWIGAKMTGGKMYIPGDAGRHLGSEMRDGEIHVEGNAGDWVGGEMRGGLIHVKGNAGHLIGAAYRGSARGMTGGSILIEGDVGNEIGHTMRRGLLAVGGTAGDLIGFNMLAGTILLFGDSGIRHGAGMRRGTIAFLGAEHPELLPSFRRACRFRPPVFAVLLRHLRELGFPLANDALDAVFDLHHGDLIDGGRGEILLRVPAA